MQKTGLTETITPDEYRDGIRNLMIDYLSIRWARANMPAGCGLYGVHDARPPIPAIPDHMPPTLYAKAQADAVAMGPGA